MKWNFWKNEQAEQIAGDLPMVDDGHTAIIGMNGYGKHEMRMRMLERHIQNGTGFVYLDDKPVDATLHRLKKNGIDLST